MFPGGQAQAQLDACSSDIKPYTDADSSLNPAQKEKVCRVGATLWAYFVAGVRAGAPTQDGTVIEIPIEKTGVVAKAYAMSKPAVFANLDKWEDPQYSDDVKLSFGCAYLAGYKAANKASQHLPPATIDAPAFEVVFKEVRDEMQNKLKRIRPPDPGAAKSGARVGMGC